jgi:hypothetical protein
LKPAKAVSNTTQELKIYGLSYSTFKEQNIKDSLLALSVRDSKDPYTCNIHLIYKYKALSKKPRLKM